MRKKIEPGTLTLIEVVHDSWCPTLGLGQGDECLCKPTLRFHKDQEHFVNAIVNNRQARRKAAREAAKAMQRAAKGH